MRTLYDAHHWTVSTRHDDPNHTQTHSTTTTMHIYMRASARVYMYVRVCVCVCVRVCAWCARACTDTYRYIYAQ